MPVRILCPTTIVRFSAAMIAATLIVPTAQAEPQKPVRIIAITKDNAARSAADIAAAKSPFIGEPPPGKLIRAEPDWRNARAALPEGEPSDAPRDDQDKSPRVNDTVDSASLALAPDRAQVQIIKPGKSGSIVETHIVPRHTTGRNL